MQTRDQTACGTATLEPLENRQLLSVSVVVSDNLAAVFEPLRASRPSRFQGTFSGVVRLTPRGDALRLVAQVDQATRADTMRMEISFPLGTRLHVATGRTYGELISEKTASVHVSRILAERYSTLDAVLAAGRTFEVRVTFAPSPGKITAYHQPGGYGVRVDTMAYEQYKVQPYYDSLVAKLVVTGQTREIALKRMQRALNEYVIEGIKTNIPFHKRVLTFPAFVSGRYDTRIVDQILNPPAPEEAPKPAAAS